MTATELTPPADLVALGFTTFDHFAESHALADRPGARQAAVVEAASGFRQWFAATGTPRAVETCDLVSLPYPREFAFFRASVSPAPFVRIYNRMMVVQWRDADGRTRTLLVEPTDFVLSANAPFFSRVAERLGPGITERLVQRVAPVTEHLARLGIAPDDVDYLTFDHLHTQDLRRWLGTTEPQPDLVAAGLATAGEPVEPVFPNARLLVQRPEWAQLRGDEVSALQWRFYQPAAFRHVRQDRVVLMDDDVLLGPGVAVVRTPGHALGNHSIVLHTDSGIWVTSENAMHAECLSPERSRMPGLARLSREYGLEVVLNANTPEHLAAQYGSMLLEKAVADRGGPGGEWVQFFPSSELTPWRLAPGCAPSFTYGAVRHGSIG